MINDFKTEYICGRKSQVIADKVWDTGREDSLDDLKDGDIVWCVRANLDQLLVELNKHPSKKIVLISCNGDWPVDKKVFQNKSECIKIWFSQNIDYQHPDLFQIPIGLENDFGPSKGRYTDYPYLTRTIHENVNDREKVKDKVYCNFNIKNNLEERKKTLLYLERNGLGIFGERKRFTDYCEDLMKHMFIISPNGNGIDCHRTWETLYLGSIPIVQSHFMFDEYGDLPLIQIDNIEEITPEWLQSKVEWYNSSTFDYEKLRISYWTKKIKEASLTL